MITHIIQTNTSKTYSIVTHIIHSILNIHQGLFKVKDNGLGLLLQGLEIGQVSENSSLDIGIGILGPGVLVLLPLPQPSPKREIPPPPSKKQPGPPKLLQGSAIDAAAGAPKMVGGSKSSPMRKHRLRHRCHFLSQTRLAKLWLSK
uniref:Uncharacterized protein n=1 Tax=Opuntia streptacantha TaxID=393608 RepID=A0A7C8YFV5_OPUST